MNRRITVLTLCAILLALCASASAQQAKKIYRIGYLSSSDPASESTRAEAIRLALRELGYIEGQNIAFEYRYTGGKRDRATETAAELSVHSIGRPGRCVALSLGSSYVELPAKIRQRQRHKFGFTDFVPRIRN